MTNPISSPTDTISDRIQVPLFFDVDKMLEEIKAMEFQDFVYYKALPLRAPAHIIDSSIPFPPPADDYADGTWTEWLDSKQFKSAHYFTSIIDTFRQNTDVTLVRLLRLAPGAVVKEHTDPTLGLQIHKSVIRLTIPILTNDQVEFILNGTTVPMAPGECWYLRLTDPHQVNNPGTTERINLTIDMIPNEWVRSLILDQEGK